MSIRENVAEIRDRIEAARRGAEGQEVTLVAVTKTHGPETVREGVLAGLTVFGENRVQELLPKMQAAALPEPVTWRLIGHLQSNKVNKVAGVVEAVDSLDSLPTAERLNRRLLELGARCRVMIEVNTSGEASKDGIGPEMVMAFADALSRMEALEPEGLMTIGPLTGGADAARRSFAALRELRERLRRDFPQYRELSMGMSGDFELAIREGSTMVRIGSLLFGARA